MLDIKTEKNIVFAYGEGKLTESDYDSFIPVLEDLITKFGTISLYFEVRNFEGWDIKSMWEDLKFDVKHRNDFEKIAIVGDQKWHDYMTQFMKPFTSAEVKYYDLKDYEIASDWIRS